MPLPLPSETDDPIRLADWLELYALVSADSNSSRGDLERALNRAGGLAQDAIETSCSDVFGELSSRQVAARGAYPFSLENSAVVLRGSIDDYLPYVFCLLLSYFGWRNYRGATIFPRRLFEDLAALAAKNFVQGDSYRFAAPRKNISQFKGALEYVCSRMGEGEGAQDQDARFAQDDNLDIVAWRHFPDKMEGKLILFGQCASGKDWKGGKLTSLIPDLFTKYWLRKQPVQVIRAYFIPHRVDRGEWYRVSIFGGILFDRCRLSYWVHSGKKLKAIHPYIDWVNDTLAPLR